MVLGNVLPLTNHFLVCYFFILMLGKVVLSGSA